jgi:hypothetical protein
VGPSGQRGRGAQRGRARRWAEVGRERRDAGAREREGGSMGQNRPSREGEEFSFLFFLSFLFLNPFSPLYKYSFIFSRCQNEIICEALLEIMVYDMTNEMLMRLGLKRKSKGG